MLNKRLTTHAEQISAYVRIGGWRKVFAARGKFFAAQIQVFRQNLQWFPKSAMAPLQKPTKFAMVLPRARQDVPKSSPRRSKKLQDVSKTSSRSPKTLPRPQRCRKMATKWLNMAPGWLRKAPRWLTWPYHGSFRLHFASPLTLANLRFPGAKRTIV